MPRLAPRELAACSWAFSTLRYAPDIALLQALTQRCMQAADQFSSQVVGSAC